MRSRDVTQCYIERILKTCVYLTIDNQKKVKQKKTRHREIYKATERERQKKL